MATELEKLREVVVGFEGTKKNAYIPISNGKVIGKSGVTIGKGLDLGQQSTESINALKDYGLSEDLAKRLREHPDLGKKFTNKTEAEATFTPLALTEEEETALNNAIVDKYKKDFYDAYEANVGRKITDDLTENQRIALISASFNLGSEGLFKNSDGTPTRFKTQLVNKQFDQAAKNLGSWGKTVNPELQYRRAAEAALFGNYIDYNDTNRLKESFVNERVDQTNADGSVTKVAGEGLKEFQNNLTYLSQGAIKEQEPQYNSMEELLQSKGVMPTSSAPPVSDTYRMEGHNKPYKQTTEPVNISTESTGFENPFLSVKNWWNSL